MIPEQMLAVFLEPSNNQIVIKPVDVPIPARREVNRLLKQGLETKVQATYTLHEISEAIKVYEKDMSKGKVILKPGLH